MKAKKLLLASVGILVFSLSPCYGQEEVKVLMKIGEDAVNDAVDAFSKVGAAALMVGTKSFVDTSRIYPNDGYRYGYPYKGLQSEKVTDYKVRKAVHDEAKISLSQNKIDSLSNSELLIIYYYDVLRFKGTSKEPTKITLQLVEKKIQSIEFSLEDLTPFVLCPILEDNNASKQLKGIVRRRIFMNDSIISARQQFGQSFWGENNFKDFNSFGKKTPSFPEENQDKDSNNDSVWMWIFVGLILFLIVLSIYYSYKFFKSIKPNRTSVAGNIGTINRTFVVDDKGTICSQDKKNE